MKSIQKTARKIMLTFMIVFSAAMLLPGADSVHAAKNSTTNIVKYYKKQKYAKAKQMAKKLPKNANENA